jgi:HSP20 family protein
MNLKTCILFVVFGIIVDILKACEIKIPNSLSKVIQTSVPFVLSKWSENSNSSNNSNSKLPQADVPLEKLFTEFQAFMNDSKSTNTPSVTGEWRNITPVNNNNNSTAASTASIPMDLRETKESFYCYFELPGIPKHNIDVKVKNNELVVKARKPPLEKENPDDENEKIIQIERKSGEWKRSFTVPENVDLTSIHAETTDGILEIKMTKKIESIEHEIKVYID